MKKFKTFLTKNIHALPFWLTCVGWFFNTLMAAVFIFFLIVYFIINKQDIIISEVITFILSGLFFIFGSVIFSYDIIQRIKKAA